jgi:hypothetical protein
MHSLQTKKKNRKTPAVYAPCQQRQQPLPARPQLATAQAQRIALPPRHRVLRSRARVVAEIFCCEPTFSDVVSGAVLIQSGNSVDTKPLPRRAREARCCGHREISPLCPTDVLCATALLAPIKGRRGCYS